MPVEIRRLTIPEFSVHCPSFVDIYLSAMGYPTDIKDRQVAHWRRDTTHPGFEALCAIDRGYIVGFAYGFLGSRDHWWYHQLVKGVREQAPSSPLHWQVLSSYFEVAEVHVAPSCQSRGIGRHLLRGLTHRVPALYTVLSTPEVPDEANAAFHLYRSEGYRDLLRHYYFTGDDRPFAVLYSPSVGQREER
ncbi:GNAT family N-acetyltransferase [Corynebacterium uropygiale]|uniref:GNAT family N-acetyltransferase n=1 Tax=Corynebacterium uropygiale TaxID=1775911 RepID=A0A9X1U0A5_9CORY|nr:GNAT family N-acetyltransferase [Corynebacterium uropygiale]